MGRALACEAEFGKMKNVFSNGQMMIRFYLLVFFFCLPGLNASLVASPDFDRDVQPFLNEYCVRCHNEEKQKGDFRLDELSRDVGVKDAPLWAEVMERISSGEMPPEDEESYPHRIRERRWLRGWRSVSRKGKRPAWRHVTRFLFIA